MRVILPNKYRGPGVYCIRIYNHIVYVGQSKEMVRRVHEHTSLIMNPWRLKDKGYRNKYVQLNRVYNSGVSIDFDVLYRGEDIDYMEAYYIDKYKPVFNYQIPFINNPSQHLNNKRAYTITLDDILSGEWQYEVEEAGFQFE